MRVLEGQQVLMRIFIGEADKHNGKPLHQALLKNQKEGYHQDQLAH